MEIDKSTGRRYLLQKHGLLGPKKFLGEKGILEFIRQAGCIQFDPIDICGKNHELVLQSRVKGFRPDLLYKLIYEDRALVDYWDKNMSILPAEDWPYMERRRRASADSYGRSAELQAAKEALITHIKEWGPICSTDVDMGKKVDWFWGPTSLARAALEALFYSGDLGVHHRNNTKRYYDCIENILSHEVLKKEDPNPSDDEFFSWNISRRIRSVGLLGEKASDAYLGILGLRSGNRSKGLATLEEQGEIRRVQVAGAKQDYFVHRLDFELLQEACTPRTYRKRMEFIAPLDNLIWDRKLIQEFFNFDYKWEIYTPEKDRKYGYYVLPVLYGEHFVGRIELVRDRKMKELLVKNLWLEPGVKRTKAMDHAMRDALIRFAFFHDVEFSVDKYFTDMVDSKK